MAQWTFSVTCGLTTFSLDYSATNCDNACNAGTPVTVYSNCSTLSSSGCVLWATDGLYADAGYYSDGTTCYTVGACP